MNITWEIVDNVTGSWEKISFFSVTGEILEVIEEFKIPAVVDGKQILGISETMHIAFEYLRDKGVKEIKKLIVEDGIEYVDPWAFSQISIKIDEFYWPSTCNTIPHGCFDSSAICEIKGIDNVTTIGPSAFAYSEIGKMVWPAKCYTIPEGCFFDSNLKEITGIESLKAIKESAFSLTDIGTFVWPQKCKGIPKKCFEFCTQLMKISGIDKVTKIDDYAFSDTKLSSFDWPARCKHIPDGCFYGTPIEEISNIEHITQIGRSAFNKALITKFIWPSKCKLIPSYCFSETPLKEIQGIEKVEGIGAKAFEGTLLQTFIWPLGVKVPKVVDCFFFLNNCKKLRRITFAENPGILEVNINLLASLEKVEVIDLSKVAVVNFIDNNRDADTSMLYEKVKNKLILPYYVAGI